MPKKHFKLMIVPPDGKQVWSIRAPKALLIAGFATLIGFVVCLVFGTVALIGSGDRDLQNADLKAENRLLKERLEGLEGTILDLTASVERTAELRRRAGILANIDDVDDEYSRMGIGGPVFADDDPLAQHDMHAAITALDFEGRLDELETLCEFHEDSFAEIIDLLEEQTDRWKHTPSTNPVPDGWPSSGFGRRLDPFTGLPAMHNGLDFSAPKGSPVYATADGRVISSGWQPQFGKTVEIDHGYGIVTRYAHNDVLKVKRGQRVTRGQIVATVGRTGRATAPHVHYEVRVNGGPVNPWRYILTAEVVVD